MAKTCGGSVKDARSQLWWLRCGCGCGAALFAADGSALGDGGDWISTDALEQEGLNLDMVEAWVKRNPYAAAAILCEHIKREVV